QVERGARCGVELGRDEWKMLDVDSDRDDVDRTRFDASLEHELSHLLVGHLDPRKAIGRGAKRVVRTVELRVTGRPRPSMEIRRGKPKCRVRPARLQSLEVAGEKDWLVGREARPSRRSDVIPEPARRLLEVASVLVHGPGRSLADG